MVSLKNGDCLEIMNELKDHSVDAVICDLPYGVTDCAWDVKIPFGELWKHYSRIVKPRGSILLFGAQPFTTEIIESNKKDFSHIWYWHKNAPTGFLLAKRQPLREIEDISVFINGRTSQKNTFKNARAIYNPQGLKDCNIEHVVGENQSYIYDNIKPKTYVQIKKGYPRQLLKFPVERKYHNTQKPVPLLEYLVKTYTNEGGVVLDNCMGSGSTGVACINTGRNFIGIEKERKFFDIACERIGACYLDNEKMVG